VLLDVNTGEATRTAPPIGPEYATVPPFFVLPARGAATHEVLVMVLSKVVPLVVPAMKGVPRPLAPFPVTREFCLLVGWCMALAVVSFKVRFPAKASLAFFL
jgi:hypothetical protein